MIGLFSLAQFALAGAILTENDVKMRLDEIKKIEHPQQEDKSAVQNLEETLFLLGKNSKTERRQSKVTKTDSRCTK